MVVKGKVPKIRFKGFTDNWEQRKLGEISRKIGSGKTPKGGSKVYLKNGIPLIRSQNIENNNIIFSNMAYIDSKTDQSMCNSHVHKRDILLDITGASIGRSAVYNYENIANVNQHVCIIRIQNNNPFFVQTYLSSYRGQKQIDILQSGGSKQGMNFKNVASIKLLIPNKNEQDLISKLIVLLDKTISLQQRKLDQLQEIKKGFLQNLFPVEDSLVPKLRFKGFTDNWGQKKLGAITKYKNGKTHEKEQKGSGKYQLINLNSISLDGNLKNSGKYIDNCSDTLHKNDIVMILSDIAHGKLVGRTAVIPQNNVYVLNQRVACLKVDQQIDPYFLSYYLNQHQPNFRRLAGGTSQLNLSKNSIEKFNILIPSATEQQQIAKLLQINDDHIASQRRELERLKQFKKFLLQNMFI